MNNLIGAHCFTAGGLETALHTAKKLNVNVIQIFTKNNKQFEAPDISQEIANSFSHLAKQLNIIHIFSHSSYLINLAAAKEEIFKRSFSGLINELKRCDQLGIEFLVLHPGSYKNTTLEVGINNVAKAINEIYANHPNINAKILLENTAGQGSQLGYDLQHLQEIRNRLKFKDKVFYCIDTAHLWAAGYEFVNNYQSIIEIINSTLGLENIKLFHLDDSKTALGSRVDRHEHIGKGTIGLKGFKFLLNDPNFSNIPKVIETPKSKTQEEDIENLKILNSLIE